MSGSILLSWFYGKFLPSLFVTAVSIGLLCGADFLLVLQKSVAQNTMSHKPDIELLTVYRKPGAGPQAVFRLKTNRIVLAKVGETVRETRYRVESISHDEVRISSAARTRRLPLAL